MTPLTSIAGAKMSQPQRMYWRRAALWTVFLVSCENQPAATLDSDRLTRHSERKIVRVAGMIAMAEN